MKQELIEISEESIAQCFTSGDFSPLLTFIEEQVEVDKQYDMSKKKDRDACASAAYKVSRSKTLIENAGKLMAENLREQIADKLKKINSSRTKVKDQMDAIRDRVRKPLNDWEDIRIKVDVKLGEIADLGKVLNFSSESIKQNLEYLEQYQQAAGDIPEDKLTEYLEAVAESVSICEGQLQVALQREADQRELAELRAQQAERDKQEKDRQLDDKEKKFFSGGSVGKPQQAIKSVPDSVVQAADMENRRRVNKAALAALMQQCPISEPAAKSVIKAVAEGKIPNMTINYEVPDA